MWHNSAAEFSRFGKFPPQICESCGANYRYNYETLLYRYSWRHKIRKFAVEIFQNEKIRPQSYAKYFE